MTLNYRSFSRLGLLLLFLACGSIFIVGCNVAEQPEANLPLARIGWQTPWATQGQITQVLAHTNLLTLNGLTGEFKGFSYGGPLNEAALADEVDVIFTADQPALMLLAAGGEWTIIGRLMYNRVAIYVPPLSPIQTLADLKGRNVGIPFGAAAQRDALKAIQEAGLDPSTDINSINLDILEQSGIVQAGTKESWGDLDALVGFDPTPAIFEQEGAARMLHVGTVVSLILMSNDYIDEHPQAPVQFLSAFTEGYYYFVNNFDQANNWFLEESQLTFDPAVLEIAASVEPNMKANSIEDIRITLSDEDFQIIDEASDFIYDNELINSPIDFREHVNMDYAQQVMQSFEGTQYDQSHIEVVKP